MIMKIWSESMRATLTHCGCSIKLGLSYNASHAFRSKTMPNSPIIGLRHSAIIEPNIKKIQACSLDPFLSLAEVAR
mgnify:CR=1 FL=1